MGSTDTAGTSGAVKNLQSNSSSASEGLFSSGFSGSTNGSPLTGASYGSPLTGSVGIGGDNNPDDVFTVSSVLHANGMLEAPQEHADSRLFSSIITGQERMDYSLKPDGRINPGGPTESTYARMRDQGFLKPATPRPATGDAALNAEISADGKRNAVASAENRIWANTGDDSRTDFQKSQDRARLEKAKADAEAAGARAATKPRRRAAWRRPQVGSLGAGAAG